jgi:hypothetical protein
LSSEILGVKPIEPGFKRMQIKPTPADLEWVEGVYPTIKGDIKVSWKRNTKWFRMEIDIPRDTEADVYLPFFSLVEPSVSINGKEVWVKDKMIRTSDAVKEAFKIEEWICFIVEAGHYILEMM